MPEIRHPEWIHSNEANKYPFSHTATLVNDEGDVIFETTFLDASFYPVGGNAELYLSKVVVATDTVTLFIGDNFEQEVASTTFDRANPPDTIRFVDAYGRPAGLIVSESIRLSLFGSWSIGTHEFDLEQTAFVARCCHAVPSVGLRGFELDDGNVVTGDVWLVGDDGVILTCEDAEIGGGCRTTEQVKVIRIDIVGDPLFRRKLCSQPGVFENPKFLQTLTFCSPSLLGSSSISSEDSSSLSLSSSLVFNDADILFFIDTTGSMDPAIGQIKAIFTPLVQEIEDEFPGSDLLWGVVEYKDIFDAEEFESQGYREAQTFTGTPSLVQTALNNLITGGGGDEPECQIWGFSNVANNWTTTLGGRESATKIIVWIGDQPGHINSQNGHDYGTVAEVITALTNMEATVIACNTEGASAGLDALSHNSQATAIVEATDGTLVHNITTQTTDELKEILVDALGEAIQSGGGIKVTRRVTTTVFPGQDGECVTCGPGEFGDVKLFVHSLTAPDTILRIRPVKEGLVIETVGERLEDIR